MPNISSLPASPGPSDDDLLVVENDPGGTPETQKATVAQLRTAINSDPMQGDTVVRVVYLTVAVSGVGADGWYLAADTTGNATVATLTGRTCPIEWNGTSAQIPAPGAGATAFRWCDVANERASSL